MYFEDLGTRWYFPLVEGVRTIGWLSGDRPIPQAPLPAEFQEKLLWQLDESAKHRNPPWVFMGLHTCEFCGQSRGTGELFIPTPDVLYMAPTMIGHYVVQHRYSPPAEFVDAVLACPAQDSDEYARLIQRYGPICRYEGR